MGQFNGKPTSFVKSCQGACQGILYSWKTEKHLRFHFFASLLVVGAGLYLKLSRFNWLFVTYAIGSVLIAELFNTAVERVVDLVQPGYHPLAGLIKDIAAGAVLLAALQSVIIGIFIFGAALF
jgi:undecaprenol kinase